MEYMAIGMVVVNDLPLLLESMVSIIFVSVVV
jgi:hypothetical protein